MLLRKAFPLSICLMRCLQTSNIWTSVVASPPSPAVASTSLSEMLTHSWAVCSSVFENCLTFPWLPWNSDIPNPIVQNAGSRRRRWYSFTQLYYFLPLVLIPEAEDYFQMCPAASPVITWILGRTTQRCGLGIFVPLEAMCGLSFDIEKKERRAVLYDWLKTCTVWQAVHMEFSPGLQQHELKMSASTASKRNHLKTRHRHPVPIQPWLEAMCNHTN